jgi:hypothetical protein
VIRSTAVFAGVSLALVMVTGWLLTLAWPDPAARHAVYVSAIIALVVQLFAFAVAKLSARTNVLAGWGVGVLLRFVVLAAYALVGAKALGLLLTPALISLVAYFFVTSLAEPVLLKT